MTSWRGYPGEKIVYWEKWMALLLRYRYCRRQQPSCYGFGVWWVRVRLRVDFGAVFFLKSGQGPVFDCTAC